MPQKLTDEWKLALGDDAERIHGWYRDRLANLTLSGVNRIPMRTSADHRLRRGG